MICSISNPQIDDELRVNRDTPRRKSRKRISVRMPEDITEEELDNVADRAKDKILDKENVRRKLDIEHRVYLFLHNIQASACEQGSSAPSS